MDSIFNANGDTQSIWGEMKQEAVEPYLNPTHSLSGTSNDHSPYTDLSNDPNLNGDPSGLFAQDDSWAYGGYDIGDEQGDAKRRRIARACDSCRRKKIKCDAKMPKCSHCENYNNECVFTHVEKKRAPPKGAKYIEGLENRLGRMEHLLRLSGLLNDDDDGGDLGILEQRLAQQANGRQQSPKRSASGSNSTRHESQPQDRRKSTPQQSKSAIASGRSSPRLQHGDQKAKDTKIVKDEEVNDLADMMWCSLMTNSSGETRFIGSSSGFSIFSPKGIEWVNSRTGDDSFKDMIAHIAEDEAKWYPWREEVFNDIFARKVFKPLPPREECESLMTEFFESFNRMFPLFHEPTFMHLIDMQYSSSPYEGSGWWACLNVSLAIAHRIRMIKTQNIQEHEGQSWAYFKNSLAVLSELTMRNTDMLSIQALVGMCLFLQGSPNPQPAFFLISAAIRLSHSIGLHKHGSGFGLNPAEVEQRKRVFWIAYMIDKDISIRSGRPPAQDDDDWNVDLPSEDPEDGVGTVPLADGSKSNLFLVLCNYAVINAKVYNKLYSVKAARQSDGELLTTIGELDVELEAWKNSIPIDFRPEHDLAALPPQLVIHIVILHFSYYNCLATIHRRSVHHGYWTSRLSNFAAQGLNVKPLNPRVFSSAALCVSAARTTIHLIKYIPPSDYAFVWLILYYPTSAMVTIFANILQNPQDARARPDLNLINFFVQFLERVSKEDATGSLKRMWLFTSQLERIASIVLDRAEKEMTSGQKRKQEREREKIAKRPNDTVEIPQPTRNSLEVQRPVEGFPYYAKPTQAQQQQHRSSSDPSANSKPSIKGPVPSMAQQQSYQPQPFVDLIDPATAPRPSFSNNFTPMPTNPQASQAYGNNNNNMHGPFSSDLMASAFDNNVSTEASSPENSAPNMNWSGLGPGYTFQQPMVPHELWNMPMTFEWDWAMPDNTSSLGMSPSYGMGMNQMPSYDMNSFDLSGTMNGMTQDQLQPQQQQQQQQQRGSDKRDEGRPY